MTVAPVVFASRVSIARRSGEMPVVCAKEGVAIAVMLEMLGVVDSV